MPELAEVETWRRLAERAALGRRIVRVWAAQDRKVMDQTAPAELTAWLPGRRVEGAHRKGKHLWLSFDQPGHLYLHFGMSGELLHRGPAEARPPHAKLELVLDDGTALTYRNPRRIGHLRWHADAAKAANVAALGPDPLLENPPLSFYREALAGRRAPIKSVLLDQTVFAGVGNWIADEVLYQARIAPRTSAADLDTRQIRVLRDKLQAILTLAVDVGADDTQFPKTWLFHHRWGKQAERTGRGEAIVFETIGGRTAAWVPSRQR
jgi:formamidopyrimidine-DNA glycosylase